MEKQVKEKAEVRREMKRKSDAHRSKNEMHCVKPDLFFVNKK